MFEQFRRIRIKGGYFEEERELELFKENKTLSIVYGRNGSGKSTIARCLKQLAESEEERVKREEKVESGEETRYVVTGESPIKEEYKQGVFVFDEDFLRNNVRVENNGLNTIVMLGEQVELDEKINAKKEELNKKKEECDKQDELVKKYENNREPISPLYYWNQIRDGLREDGGWADIDRELKGNTQKSRITEDLVAMLQTIEEPKETYEKLREQVVADKSLYLESEDSQVIEWNVGELKLPESLQELKALLEKPLDSPTLTEREYRLMDLLTKTSPEPQHFNEQHTRHMLEKGWTFCPLCLREITDKDRISIQEVLKNLLNKESDEFNEKLNASYNAFREIEVVLPEFPGNLYKEKLQGAITAQEELNKVLAVVRENIDQRKRNIYKSLQISLGNGVVEKYVNVRTAWKTVMEGILKCVETFNETVNKRNKLLEKVRHENNQLARKQLASVLKSYQMALDNKTKAQKTLQELHNQREALMVEIKQLNAQKENTDMALEYINQELQYVFYSNRKVKLIPGEGCYKLVVNGKEVKPKKISVGERNVLGLCYFFAMLFDGKRNGDKYASEYLIVLDDPISSFDYGNRLGVMSLLRYQFNNIKKGNKNSRILVMSHDLQSVFDLVKIRRDLQDGNGEKKFLELENKNIKEQTIKNEYQKLLMHVYEYASCASPEDIDDSLEMGIGNIMRRMLEAFASFCYNKPFELMMRTEGLLDNIPQEKRGYYENFMCRLALNGESHGEERSYILDNVTPFFTKEEKLRTAKGLLLFLLYVNEPHIKAYLKSDMVEKIESWKGEEHDWLIG